MTTAAASPALTNALTSLRGGVNDAIAVHSDLSWSAFDNFEWPLGYMPEISGWRP